MRSEYKQKPIQKKWVRCGFFVMAAVLVFASTFFVQESSFPPALAQPACTNPPANLHAWWTGDGVSTDLQGNANATLVGDATYATGFVGYGFTFDGVDTTVDDEVSTTDVSGMQIGTGDFTVEMWAKTSVIKSYSTLFSFDTFAPALYIRNSGKLHLWPYDQSSDATLNDGQWHHVGITRTGGSNITYYIDGAAAGTATFGGAINPSVFRIGNDNCNCNEVFDGEIDEVSLYTRALTAQEFSDIFTAGMAGKCRTSICGNSSTEAPEQCDDGNVVFADGCDVQCRLTGVCGDSTVELQETCDDGNTTGGDGCSAICQIEVCGNNVIDVGETCDDGNAVSNDGCNATCQTEVCGDSIVQGGIGEQCDDGNAIGGDGCSATCQNEICGNSVIEGGEECDDGNAVSNDGCSATCDNEVCGDSVVQPGIGEQCDDGNTTAGDGCNSTCQNEICGNSTVDVGEQCDDGNTDSNDGCSATCQNEVCGDSVVQTGIGEQCDDGNGVSGDGCTSTCQTGGVCGDSAITFEETCDDANTTAGDGCSSVCQEEPGFDCSGTPSVCGAAQCVNPPSNLVHWWAGDGDATDEQQLSDGVLVGDAAFAAGKVGQAFTFDGVDDVIDDAVDVTDVSNMQIGTGDFTVEMWAKTSATKSYSTLVSFDTFAPALYIRNAGELQLWPHTVSNAGGTNDGEWHHVGMTRTGGSTITYYIDGVAAGTATYATAINPSLFRIGNDNCNCGEVFDGEIDEVEFYDRALTAQEMFAIYDAGASGKCKTGGCGNGIVGAGEQCDDGNTVSGDGCTSTCQTGGVCGDSNVQFEETCDDGNTTAGDGCSAVCQTEVCGNGTLEPGIGELCDDGNTTGGDGCSATCQTEACGNSVVDVGEQCDDGNTTDFDGCSATCQNAGNCGDGVVELAETCDDANATAGDGCSASCLVEQGFVCNGAPSVCGPIPCVDAPANMRHWWDGEGNTEDIQGSADGVIEGSVTYATGKVGQAFSFSGAASEAIRVSAGSNMQVGTGDFTIDAWVQTTNTGSYRAIVSFDEYIPALYFSDGELNWYNELLPSSDHESATGGLADGAWHHVAVTRTAGTIRFYIDGVLDANTYTDNTAINPVDFLIGSDDCECSEEWIGLIDEVEFFDRALSLAEIQSIYTADAAGKCKGATQAQEAGRRSGRSGASSSSTASGTDTGSGRSTGERSTSSSQKTTQERSASDEKKDESTVPKPAAPTVQKKTLTEEEQQQVRFTQRVVEGQSLVKALQSLFAWTDPVDYWLLPQYQRKMVRIHRYQHSRAFFERIAGFADLKRDQGILRGSKAEVENLAELMKVLVNSFSQCFSASEMGVMTDSEQNSGSDWWVGYSLVLNPLFEQYFGQNFLLWSPLEGNVLPVLEGFLSQYCR